MAPFLHLQSQQTLFVFSLTVSIQHLFAVLHWLLRKFLWILGSPSECLAMWTHLNSHLWIPLCHVMSLLTGCNDQDLASSKQPFHLPESAMKEEAAQSMKRWERNNSLVQSECPPAGVWSVWSSQNFLRNLYYFRIFSKFRHYLNTLFCPSHIVLLFVSL